MATAPYLVHILMRLSSLPLFADRVERTGAKFAEALRTLADEIAPLRTRYRISVITDGANCVMARFEVRRDLVEISVAADLCRGKLAVHLLIPDSSGDLDVKRIVGPNPVRKAVRKAFGRLRAS